MKVYGQLVFKPLALMKVLRSTHFTNFISTLNIDNFWGDIYVECLFEACQYICLIKRLVNTGL